MGSENRMSLLPLHPIKFTIIPLGEAMEGTLVKRPALRRRWGALLADENTPAGDSVSFFTVTSSSRDGQRGEECRRECRTIWWSPAARENGQSFGLGGCFHRSRQTGRERCLHRSNRMQFSESNLLESKQALILGIRNLIRT